MGSLIMVILATLDPAGFWKACTVVVPFLTLGMAFFYAPIRILIVPIMSTVILFVLNSPIAAPETASQITIFEKAVFWGKFVDMASYLILVIVIFANYFFGRKPTDSLANVLAAIFFKKSESNH